MSSKSIIIQLKQFMAINKGWNKCYLPCLLYISKNVMYIKNNGCNHHQIFCHPWKKNILMMNDENKTDGRAYKVPRLSFYVFFCLFISYSPFYVFISCSFFSFFLSLFVLLVVFIVRTNKKRRETRQISTYSQPIEENQLMYDQKQLVDFVLFF
jgi:hypothetical protein